MPLIAQSLSPIRYSLRLAFVLSIQVAHAQTFVAANQKYLVQQPNSLIAHSNLGAAFASVTTGVTLEVHEPLLVNALGHSAGAVIFAIFLYLLLRDRGGARLEDSSRAIAAATLALIWSVASLALLVNSSRLLIALSSSALSLLPAVLLDVSLSGKFPWIRRAGYFLSTSAILAHTVELFGPFADFHRPALILITIGFGGLTVLAALQGGPRLLPSMSLFLFAMSFLHLQTGIAHSTWSIELILHHAGIPLSLFVLLQDYRSVLVDALVRFSANMLLACAFAIVSMRAIAMFPPLEEGIAQWLSVLAAALGFVLFAMARSSLQRLLTKLVFRRGDLAEALRKLKAGPQGTANEDQYTAWVRQCVAEFFHAGATGVPSSSLAKRINQVGPPLATLAAALPEFRKELEELGVEAIAPLKVSGGEPQFVLLGRRQGGRPYLSEDLEAIAMFASQASEQIELFRETELRKLITQAELRALQSQIHPHFLFNALNTLYGVIPRQAAGARQTVLNLADIFRYFLRGEKTYIALEEEVHIIKAYLEIESLRLGSKLKTEIDVSREALAVRIPVLSVEPLVENAVKHGVASQQKGGLVRLSAYVEEGVLIVSVHDSGPGFSVQEETKGEGVGLENVRRRLELCYGAHLVMNHDETGTEVSFRIPASVSSLEVVR